MNEFWIYRDRRGNVVINWSAIGAFLAIVGVGFAFIMVFLIMAFC